MTRLQHHLQTAIANGARLRELSREIGIPVASVHNYAYQGVHPNRNSLEKLTAFFNEPTCILLSDDDDATAAIISKIRQLSQTKKQAIAKQLGL